MTEMVAMRAVPPISWKGVPLSYKGKLSAVCRSAKECDELIYWFGAADFCPVLPILVMVPGAQPTLIPGFGFVTASELRDCAVYAWFTQSDKIKKRGNILDFDALREKHGLMRREEVDAAIREAFYERIKKHKANPITDPPRLPQYVRPNERTVFAVDGTKERTA